MCVCVCVFVCVCLFCRLCCILKLKTAEGWFFKRVRLCMWAIGRQQLGNLSIPVHNSLIVHHSSWALKFDNFSEFQNVLVIAPRHTHTHNLASLWRFAYENPYLHHPLALLIYLVIFSYFDLCSEIFLMNCLVT